MSLWLCDKFLCEVMTPFYILHPNNHAHVSRFVMLCCGVKLVNLAYRIDGLVQERRNSIASALQLRFSYTDPTICSYFTGTGAITLLVHCQCYDEYTICIHSMARKQGKQKHVYMSWDI